MLTDETLYERVLAGDLEAFDALYARYERPLFGFICQYVTDRAEAEDLFHEAFMALLRAREAGRSIRSFRAWIYRVTRNVCLNKVRGRKRAARAHDAIARAPTKSSDQPEGAMMRRETAQALRRAVDVLPAQLKELYSLRSSGMSYEELSEVLGIPLGTVKSRIHTMIKQLRLEIEI